MESALSLFLFSLSRVKKVASPSIKKHVAYYEKVKYSNLFYKI